MEEDELSFVDRWHQDRDDAIRWARGILARADVVFLDTETTGLNGDDEIVQVGVLDHSGQPLMDDVTVKSLKPIPAGATAVHGITNAMVENKPAFGAIYEQLRKLCEARTVVIYNAEYDMRMISQTCAKHHLEPFAINAECAMLQFAAFVGEWNDYRGCYRWQKLRGAVHGAIGDCQAMLEIVRFMAKAKTSEEDRVSITEDSRERRGEV